jgi:hypothetical protein
MRAVEFKTGKVIYEERLNGSSGSSKFFSSPVAADGKIFQHCFDEEQGAKAEDRVTLLITINGGDRYGSPLESVSDFSCRNVIHVAESGVRRERAMRKAV